jgi:3-deoxy-D-arabino-heptulosonate 7-phosphate (DAHP) synthase class II
MDLIQDAHLEWIEDRTKQVIIISIITLIGTPILVVLGRSIYRGTTCSRNWVDENKTI